RCRTPECRRNSTANCSGSVADRRMSSASQVSPGGVSPADWTGEPGGVAGPARPGWIFTVMSCLPDALADTRDCPQGPGRFPPPGVSRPALRSPAAKSRRVAGHPAVVAPPSAVLRAPAGRGPLRAARADQLVGRVDHHRLTLVEADPAAEPDPA